MRSQLHFRSSQSRRQRRSGFGTEEMIDLKKRLGRLSGARLTLSPQGATAALDPKRTLRALGCGRASAARRGAQRYSVFRG
jgi:hypothetical protein